MSGIIQSIASTGASGGGNTFQQRLVTPAPEAFWNPKVIFTNNSTQWRSVEWDTGVLSAVSGAIFTQKDSM